MSTATLSRPVVSVSEGDLRAYLETGLDGRVFVNVPAGDYYYGPERAVIVEGKPQTALILTAVSDEPDDSAEFFCLASRVGRLPITLPVVDLHDLPCEVGASLDLHLLDGSWYPMSYHNTIAEAQAAYQDDPHYKYIDPRRYRVACTREVPQS